MDNEPQLPLVKAAFDDPDTRAAWERTRRRVVRRLWLWSGLFVVALAVGSVLTGLDAAGPGAAVLVLSVLFYVGAVYACRGALSRLARARSVLETHPWQRLTAVRRITGEKEATGVVVQFRLLDGDDAWSQTLSARDPLRWNRWDSALEQGAWFAGDPRLGGVLARPGGHGLMTVQRRTQVLASERLTARADHDSLLAAAADRRG